MAPFPRIPCYNFPGFPDASLVGIDVFVGPVGVFVVLVAVLGWTGGNFFETAGQTGRETR